MNSKLIDTNEFSQYVEKLSSSESISILDALLHIIDKYDLDIFDIKSILNNRITELLTSECISLNLIQGEQSSALLQSYFDSSVQSFDDSKSIDIFNREDLTIPLFKTQKPDEKFTSNKPINKNLNVPLF